jgi:uncharacterized protein YecE (DUF72 family)
LSLSVGERKAAEPGSTNSPRIGTAGWAIPRAIAGHFPESGSALERYVSHFNAAEINSTFRRSHKPETWRRWAATVPKNFRFAVKMPKAISHEQKLVGSRDTLIAFVNEVTELGDRLGPILLQLPPSLAYDAQAAEAFFALYRSIISTSIVCEPRHESWFGKDADALMKTYDINRVAADPARVEAAGRPGGSRSLEYYRLHGAPRIYYSAYDPIFLAELAADMIKSRAKEVWCIFDNTASGAAAANALALKSLF